MDPDIIIGQGPGVFFIYSLVETLNFLPTLRRYRRSRCLTLTPKQQKSSPARSALASLSPSFTGTFSQVHQHFMSSFCANILSIKNYKTKTLTKEKLHKTLLHKKLLLNVGEIDTLTTAKSLKMATTLPR